MNRTLLEKVRCMLSNASLGKQFAVWNVCVSGRHLSTSEVISSQSIAMWPKRYIP